MPATYYSDIQKLYVAYFGRPRDVDGLNYWETVTSKAQPNHTQTTAEILRGAKLASPNASADRHYGPDAKLARRDQIRRNGGKR